MADVKPPQPEGSPSTIKPDAKASKPVRPPNPVWKMLGLPNMRLRLPSRNWMIFLSVTGSISAAVIYDKREKRRAQRKWCKLVEHLALEPLEANQMPRTLTVFLEGPPADGLRVAQDHFKDYVKPILVSSGLDWDFIQGRKEGDVRAILAEKIRKLRRPPVEEEEDITGGIRRKNGIKTFDGPRGDIVIGRHVWKEYVRGLHEGWLGPLEAPVPVPLDVENSPDASESIKTETAEPIETLPGITILPKSEKSTSETPPESSPEKTVKPEKPAPFISTSDYSSASLPSNLPSVLDPSIPIAFPHILGFLNTPTRMFRFFTRRHLADKVGRETAAIVLAASRPYNETSTGPFSDSANSSQSEEGMASEQNSALVEEEADWIKSVHKRVDGEAERPWLDSMALDPRIASRMRRAELSAEDEERANRIVITEEEIEGWIKGGLRKMWRTGTEMLTAPKKKHASELLREDEGEKTWEEE